MVEMLVSLVVNVIVLFALISIFSSNLSNMTSSTNIDALSQQLEVAMQIMADNIRRAGYWSNASSNLGAGSNNNPFMAAATDISVTGGNCILFTYDSNSTGSLPSITSASDDDRYGYRLVNQTLQTRPYGATFACNAAASNWENVTNPTIVQITALSFTLNSSTVPVGAVSNTMLVRSVDISITGQLTSNNAVTKTLTQHVRIMNDKFVP